MPDYDDQIQQIEKEMSTMQYNKRTQHHYGLLRAKIAKLKEAQVKRSSGGKKGEGYSVKKSGDATVIIIGFPSSGKSTLLNSLTGSKSAVGAYAFTTLTVIPGLLVYKHAKIQILDVPGIVHGAASGRGRGKEVLAVMRNADLCIILLEVHHPEHLPVLQKEIYEADLRLDQKPPDVKIAKKSRGGISMASTVPLTKAEPETFKGIMKEFRIFNADVVIRDDITVDQFIDCIEGNKKYLPCIIVLNKMDTVSERELQELRRKTGAGLCISAQEKINIGQLKDAIYDKLNFISVYCKEARKKADMDVPMIMLRGSTVQSMCEKLHREFTAKFKYARVWGASAKFPGQKHHLPHVLADGDIVELHIK
ncbi:GTP-binding protein [Candidatus Woesearchaeota archaeon]|nr:GTP-binding protein [Candidatus Woesearchaeota archaeon]